VTLKRSRNNEVKISILNWVGVLTRILDPSEVAPGPVSHRQGRTAHHPTWPDLGPVDARPGRAPTALGRWAQSLVPKGPNPPNWDLPGIERGRSHATRESGIRQKRFRTSTIWESGFHESGIPNDMVLDESGNLGSQNIRVLNRYFGPILEPFEHRSHQVRTGPDGLRRAHGAVGP